MCCGLKTSKLAQKISKTKVSLFAEKKSGDSLSGVWKSLTNQTLILSLRAEGEFLYGTGKEDDGSQSYDLKKQEDGTYKGLGRGRWKSWYEEYGNKTDVTCNYENELEILSFTSNRIEGRVMAAPYPKSNRAQIKYIKTCGESEAKRKTWTDFVWVRAD